MSRSQRKCMAHDQRYDGGEDDALRGVRVNVRKSHFHAHQKRASTTEYRESGDGGAKIEIFRGHVNILKKFWALE